MSNDDNIEFDYLLTKELGLGTVAHMETVMSAKEYLYWTRYYAVQRQRAELERKKQEARARSKRR